MSARILNVSIAEYHADPCDTPSLSSSIAHELVTRSPMHAYELHARLGGKRRPPTAAKNNGSIAHELLLGKGGGYVRVKAKDFKTDAAKRMRDGAEAMGQVPILEHDFLEAEFAAEEIRERLLARGVDFTQGGVEVPIEWTQALETGESVLCRSLLDHVDGPVITDLKTARSACPDHVERVIYEYGYDIQATAYERALAALVPELAGRITYRFAFVETEPPYGTCVYELTGEFQKIGRDRWERACAAWAHWVRQPPPWPGYPTNIVRVGPPAWVRTREERVAADAAE